MSPVALTASSSKKKRSFSPASSLTTASNKKRRHKKSKTFFIGGGPVLEDEEALCKKEESTKPSSTTVAKEIQDQQQQGKSSFETFSKDKRHVGSEAVTMDRSRVNKHATEPTTFDSLKIEPTTSTMEPPKKVMPRTCALRPNADLVDLSEDPSDDEDEVSAKPTKRVGIHSDQMKFIHAIAQKLSGRPQEAFKAIAAKGISRHQRGDAMYDNLPNAILRDVQMFMQPTDYMGAYVAVCKGIKKEQSPVLPAFQRATTRSNQQHYAGGQRNPMPKNPPPILYKNQYAVPQYAAAPVKQFPPTNYHYSPRPNTHRGVTFATDGTLLVKEQPPVSKKNHVGTRSIHSESPETVPPKKTVAPKPPTAPKSPAQTVARPVAKVAPARSALKKRSTTVKEQDLIIPSKTTVEDSHKTGLQLALRYGYALCLKHERSRPIHDMLEQAEITLKGMSASERDKLWDDVAEFTKDE